MPSPRPAMKPGDPRFSSGPCPKRPGWSLPALEGATLGRSHRMAGAKANALLRGKYSPDIEDIQATAKPIFRHRIVRNFKAEAEEVTVDNIIDQLL